MNNAKQISNLFFIVSILLTSCNKERPIVLTSEISDITVTTATGGGEIASDGGESILTKGVCWSIEKEPTIDDQHTADGTGIQPFTSNLKGLAPGTVYYVRAYAVNVNGTGYGPEESFKTAGDLPSVNTKSANVISAVEAKLNGSVNANGLVTTVTFEYGTSNNYNKSVQAMPDKVSGDTISSVLVTIIGLSPSTTYHYRVKAENSLGISYGNDLTFNTASIAPDVTTKPATLVTDRTAVLNGNIDPNNLSCTVKFEYGTTTSYGLAIVAVPDELSGDSLKDVSATLTGLTPNTTYHYRIKASNSAGISEGLDNTFITVADTADATTLSASQVDAYTATLNGSVNPNNSSCVVRFEYRKANASYNIVAASPMNLNGNGEKVITASLSGLLPNTTYYYRVKAENTIGTAYGSELSFTTIDAPPEPLLTSVSSASVRYGSILTVYGANLGSITEVCIGSASQYIVVTPASMSADSIKIDIYNHENPLQLLPFSAFKIGIKYHGGSKWTDQVTISSSWKRLADFP
ncbi:MAG TPA: hypothetical protein VHO46_08330, partial [Bacteroidales bacterium]|nr:hypothetical protein [Bacteroidales bacterium]